VFFETQFWAAAGHPDPIDLYHCQAVSRLKSCTRRPPAALRVNQAGLANNAHPE